MLEKSSQKQKVYDFLSEQLNNGTLKKNDKLSEQYFAEKLNISRTPVREALFKLAADGILEHIPQKGFRIKEITAEDAKNIYELIGTLDGKVAVLAGPFLDEVDYTNMQFLIEAMDAAIKNKLYTKYNELQHQFHDVYLMKSPNKVICETLEKYKRFFIDRTYNIDNREIQDILLQTNEEHRTILFYFKEGEYTELRDFIENQHWRMESAQYDRW